MPTLMRIDYIEPKKKEVVIATGFLSNVPKTPEIENDILLLIRCFENGTPIQQRFYRLHRETTPDQLLADRGIMHLHVGGAGSKELLFLYQFDVAVVLIGLTNHSPFEEVPVGQTISNLTSIFVSSWLSGYDQQLSERKEAIRAKIASGLLPKKPK